MGSEMSNGWTRPQRPQRYVYRDIGIGLDENDELQFGFVNDDRAESLGDKTIEYIVDHLPRAPDPGAGGLSRLARPETPLDLEVEGQRPPIYIILRIVSPPNMTFQPGKKALSHKDRTGEERYGLLRHAYRGSHANVAGDNCKIAYFACEPSTLREYHDGFNLRVRLRQTSHLDPPGGNRILDIEIDPDIRFPGGSPT